MVTKTLCLRLALLLAVALAIPGGCTRPQLEEVARLEQGPGNITVTLDERIIVSLHQFFGPKWRVVEVEPGGKLVPFPNEAWAGGKGAQSLDSVLGIQSDSRGRVWMLDNGMRGKVTPKLVAWDTRADRLARVIHFPPPVTLPQSFLNDLAVDEHHNAVYIADPAPGKQAALIVVDLNTGLARRVLQGDRSVVAEDLDLVIDGKAVEVRRKDGSTQRPRVGINPIAVDAEGRWLYYGPMHGTSMYRIPTQELLNTSLKDADLAKKVERYSDKPICDGISMDKAGNIYVTDLANHAIGVIDTRRQYRLFLQDERLSWPNAFSFGPDDKLYVVTNQLHKTAALNPGGMAAKPPYFIFRTSARAPGMTGR